MHACFHIIKLIKFPLRLNNSSGQDTEFGYLCMIVVKKTNK